MKSLLPIIALFLLLCYQECRLNSLARFEKDSLAIVEAHGAILNQHTDEITTLGKLSSQQSGLMKQMIDNLVGETANVDRLVDGLKQRYFPPMNSMPFLTNVFTNYVGTNILIGPVNK